MSAGAFELKIYEGDSGEKHVVRIQPETEAADFDGTANDFPDGPPTSPFWAKVTKGPSEYGLRPRYVSIAWTGAPPAGYLAGETVKIMVADPAVYNGITITSDVTYLGAAATVVGKTPEDIYPGI